MGNEDTNDNIGVTMSEDVQDLLDDTAPELDGKPVRSPEYLLEVSEEVTNFIENLLAKLNISSSVETTIVDGEIHVQISGYGASQAIGFRGEVLDAIQYMTLVIANKKDTDFLRVLVNAGMYRERRSESLKNLALQKAYKASVTGRRIPLDPMNPFERRIVHAALANDKYARTESTGEGNLRHVVIIPHVEKKSFGYGNKPYRPNPNQNRNNNYQNRRPNNYGDNRSNAPYGQRPQHDGTSRPEGGYNRYNQNNQNRPYNSNQQSRPYNNPNQQQRPYNPNYQQNRPYNPNQQNRPYNQNNQQRPYNPNYQQRPYNPNQSRPYNNSGYNKDKNYQNPDQDKE
ncbi:MAG: hypothetical protein LBF68_01170 [Christensenellaceae bacterium]|jgi:spoIIIJ-associated protein|nr:hypothetical protein [Christensenellaceae bacterium]